jgi:hypothetical protein
MTMAEQDARARERCRGYNALVSSFITLLAMYRYHELVSFASEVLPYRS